MDLEKKSEAIASYIRKIQRIIHRTGHRLAQTYDLTVEQYHLLIFLSKQNIPPTIGELAKRYCNAQNTMSEKISRLEEKELVKRISDSLDRRITRVVASSKGINLVHTIRKERSDKSILKVLKSMDPENVDNLLKSLEIIYDNLDKEE